MTTDDNIQAVVQHNKDLGMVGLGIEPSTSELSKHMIDQIYGSIPTQTEIGKILWERLQEDKAIFATISLKFQSSDEETEFYNDLGRCVLDAVTGSTSADGWWSWLDRSSVNRLIRLLRKARDESFGRDE